MQEQIQCFGPKCESKEPHTHWSVWAARTDETVIKGLEKWQKRRKKMARILFAILIIASCLVGWKLGDFLVK